MISTVAAVGATFSIVSQTLSIAGETATRLSNRYLSGAAMAADADAALFCIFSSARLTHATMSSTLNGLVR